MRAQQAILDKLAALPGVDSSAFVSDMALDGNTADWDAVMVEGVDYRENEVPPFRIFKYISPGSFATAGTRLIAGRDFTWTDLYERRRAIMVSENLAREVWGSASAAIGKRVRTLPAASWREVIGVVQDVSSNGLDQPPPATIYWPAFGESEYRPSGITVTRTATFMIRSSRAGTDALLREVQEAVWTVNSNLALASVRTMQDVYDRSMAQTSFTLVVLTIAAGMALTLGVVGIYGVVSYAVSRRRREIGIRVALGAPRETLTRLFVVSGLKLAAIGLPIGLSVAALLTRMMSALLFGISALDPVTFGAVPVVLTLAAIAASYLPARRAASVDPVEALKGE
jgi:predicted permease